jgi:acyl-CoA thioesterase FadM
LLVEGRILRDGEALAQGEMRYVAIDPATKRKMPNDILRDALERYAA